MSGNPGWELWYQDLFDRETPLQREVSGRDLAQGLAELWGRYLIESLLPDGGDGFARFHLSLAGGRSIGIDGERRGALRLRDWVYGARRHLTGGYLAEADPIVHRIAAAHAVLHTAGHDGGRELLEVAAEAGDRQLFEQALERIIASRGTPSATTAPRDRPA